MGILCQKYNERPQIGEVIRVPDNGQQTVKLRWYDGTYSTRWKVYTYRSGRKIVPWDEEIDIKEIITRNLQTL